MAVWAAVRVVLVFWPSDLTSLYSATHSGLFNAGGGGGMNRSAVGTTNGWTCPTHGVCGAANAVGVRRHTPGSGVFVGNTEVVPIGVWRPSPVRRDMICCAAAWPTDSPSVF